MKPPHNASLPPVQFDPSFIYNRSLIPPAIPLVGSCSRLLILLLAGLLLFSGPARAINPDAMIAEANQSIDNAQDRMREFAEKYQIEYTGYQNMEAAGRTVRIPTGIRCLRDGFTASFNLNNPSAAQAEGERFDRHMCEKHQICESIAGQESGSGPAMDDSFSRVLQGMAEECRRQVKEIKAQQAVRNAEIEFQSRKLANDDTALPHLGGDTPGNLKASPYDADRPPSSVKPERKTTPTPEPLLADCGFINGHDTREMAKKDLIKARETIVFRIDRSCTDLSRLGFRTNARNLEAFGKLAEDAQQDAREKAGDLALEGLLKLPDGLAALRRIKEPAEFTEQMKKWGVPESVFASFLNSTGSGLRKIDLRWFAAFKVLAKKVEMLKKGWDAMDIGATDAELAGDPDFIRVENGKLKATWEFSEKGMEKCRDLLEKCVDYFLDPENLKRMAPFMLKNASGEILKKWLPIVKWAKTDVEALYDGIAASVAWRGISQGNALSEQNLKSCHAILEGIHKLMAQKKCLDAVLPPPGGSRAKPDIPAL